MVQGSWSILCVLTCPRCWSIEVACRTALLYTMAGLHCVYVLCLLHCCRVMESPGLSWRVGVQPPLDKRMPTGIATLMQSKQKHAAVMELQLQLTQVRP